MPPPPSPPAAPSPRRTRRQPSARPRGCRGARARPRRGGLHSLGRTRPLSNRPQLAHRTTPIGPRRPPISVFSSSFCFSSPALAFSRAGSNAELDGEGGVEAPAPSGNVASVTSTPISAKSFLSPPVRRHPLQRLGPRPVATPVARAAALRRAVAAARAHRRARSAKCMHFAAAPTPTKSTVQRTPLSFTERLDAPDDRPHAPARRARSPMRTPRGPGVQPGPSFPDRPFYVLRARRALTTHDAPAGARCGATTTRPRPGPPPSSTPRPQLPGLPRHPLVGPDRTVGVLDHVDPAATTTSLRGPVRPRSPETTGAACAFDSVDATEEADEPEG